MLADMTAHLPVDTDVVGALMSLARLQSTYALPVVDLAAGKIAGETTVAPLSERTVFDVAVQCLGDGRPDLALRWLEHLANTTDERSMIPPASLYQAFARAFAQVQYRRKNGKASPYSITKHRVPELIPVLGSQPAGGVNHNPAVGCHYFPLGLQLPPQPLRGLLPILLLGEQRHNGCEQFA